MHLAIPTHLLKNELILAVFYLNRANKKNLAKMGRSNNIDSVTNPSDPSILSPLVLHDLARTLFGSKEFTTVLVRPGPTPG